MDRRLSGHAVHAAVLEADVRTPMAWQHRDQLYGYQQHNGELYAPAPRPSRGGSRPARTASPMDTSNTSSLSSESHIRSNSHVLRFGLPPHVVASSASVAAPWDGGDPYAAMSIPMSLAVPLPPHMLPPSMPPPLVLPPPAILLPPMMRPRPLVFPAVPSSPTPLEPLPVREPKNTMLPLPPKEQAAPRKMRCCRGGCIVLWIILGIIFVGVVLATALRFVVP